jgi:hypothetical protein
MLQLCRTLSGFILSPSPRHSMRIRYFGDSYDIVKQSLLRWLRTFGEWSVHPMFTEIVSQTDAAALEMLLDAKIVSTEVLTLDTNRSVYLASGASCGHLFLDPDTGLRMRPTRGAHAPQYLFAAELQRLVEQRPDSLTVVFDQSVGRGSERMHLEAKLQKLRDKGCSASPMLLMRASSWLLGTALSLI